MENRINQMKKTGARLLIICLVLLLLIPAATTESYGNATDTLTFKIGYYGWSPEDYVEKKTFKVSEIQSLSSGNMLAYTYYDRSGKRVGIDSAYGAKLNTLLDKAGIDKGSINALAFYTTDSGNGAFATFTWQELVLTDRYYFDNLAAAINKDGKYVDSQAKQELWNNAEKVDVVLAYQDSWKWYSAGSEGAKPSSSGMQTANRFRLCFGQSNPLDYRTFQSAKMVETIYVTFSGTPKLTADRSNLEGKVGSKHKLKVTAAAADDALQQKVQEKMTYSSSDESVAKVNSSGEIEYVGEGDATITVRSGDATTTVQVHVGKKDVKKKEPQKGDTGGSGKGGNGKGASGSGKGIAAGKSKVPSSSRNVQKPKENYMFVLSKDAGNNLKQALKKQAPAEQASMSTHQEKMDNKAEQLEIKKKSNGLKGATGAIAGIIAIEGSLFGFIRFRKML